MFTQSILALIVGAMTVTASFHYPQQPACQCTVPCSHQSAMQGGMYGGNGMMGGGMYGGNGMMGGGMYGGGGMGGMYGSPAYAGGGGYGGMVGGGMYPNGYRIKPKTKLGWDKYSGGLRLKTKYKVKPMNGGYPPVFGPTGFGQAPGYVQNHPLSQYGAAMGPTFGAGFQGQQPPMSYGYGQTPYMSGPGAYNQYGSSYNQQNCRW